jgi:benzoyl-CoA reductase/2-hydroxyglutaryl-CoA dehydratase subunit BcrC/BadD/HgdB
LDLLPIMESRGFIVDLESYGVHLEQLLQVLRELKELGVSAAPPDAPRILLTGCPVGKGSEKVLRLIEEAGGIVVCQENCTGIKSFDPLIDETDEDPYRAIARHYLQTPCSCLTPNTGRFDLIARLIKDFRIQGVVDLTWRCCLTYSVESHLLQEFLGKTGQTPFLHLETDYSSWDVEQLKTRVEAFLEVVRS